MFSKAFFAAFVATLATVSLAEPVPSEPSPGSKFNAGATCHIAWDPDTSGTWKQMSIELMSGSNLAMNHITTVVTLDGTDATKNSYDYPCPEVTPNSAIYFYQFTDPSTTNITWTTRFTIADATGNTVDPENATQPGGEAIPWGTGALVDPSKATPAPVRGAAGNSTSASASTGSTAGTSPVVSSSSAAALPSSSGITRVPASSTASSSRAAQSTSSTNSTGSTAANNNNGADILFVGQGLLLAMGTFIAALVL